MFETTLLADAGRERRWTMMAGLGGQLALLSLAVIIPLAYTDQLPKFHLTDLHILPPVGRELPARDQPARAARAHTVSTAATGKFIAPVNYHHPVVTGPDTTPEIISPGNDFVAGALPGGSAGEPAGVLTRVGHANPPPPPPPARAAEAAKPAAPAAPVQVGGRVQEAKIVHRVIPSYPVLALQSRVSGVVELIGVIGRDGRVAQLRVVSGHALLVHAAVEAVRQWVYRPTLLNGEAVEVVAPIQVRFTLSGQ